MKSNIYDIMQRLGQRLLLCFIATTLSCAVYAQDETDDSFAEEEAPTLKQPKRKTAVDNVPTCEIKGIVVDEANGQPLAGVRVQATDDNRFTAMTNATGEFTIKVPTYTTSLYVFFPSVIITCKNNNSNNTGTSKGNIFTQISFDIT